MIGEARTTSADPSSPRRTGNRPSLVHASTAGRASAGGSIEETNCPSSTASTTCSPTIECAIASSRRASPASHSDVLVTLTHTAIRGASPAAQRTSMSTTPSSSAPRSTPPSTLAESVSSTPSTWKTVDRDASAIGSRRMGSRSTSWTCPSSHVRAPSPGESTVRRSTRKKRTRPLSTGWAPGSTIISADRRHRSDASAVAYDGGTATPNCQRIWFFVAEARYGYRRYPS